MIQNPRRSDQAHSQGTDATRTERGFHADKPRSTQVRELHGILAPAATGLGETLALFGNESPQPSDLS
jgi:hypothetical protein